MAPQGLVKPTNDVLYAGEPLYDELTVELTGGTNAMYPGRLVITGTAEHQCKVAVSGSAVVIGVLDVEPNELRTTLHGSGDQARILRGDIVVLMTAVSGATIARGTLVQAAHSGKVIESIATEKAVGYALQAPSASPSTKDEEILVKLTLV